MSSLIVLMLWNNKFSGLLPRQFGNLRNLAFLYLANNQFSGSLPTSLGNFGNLQTLDAYNNNLSGALKIPSGWISLNWLDLGNNSFSGEVPASLGALTNLSYLDLSDNQLSGPLPDLTDTSLRNVILYNNNFTGDISDALSGLPIDLCPAYENDELTCSGKFTKCCETPTINPCSSNLTAPMSTLMTCSDAIWRLYSPDTANNQTWIIEPQDTIIVHGSYIQTENATLTIKINSTNVGRIVVVTGGLWIGQAEGTAQLNGTLLIHITDKVDQNTTFEIIRVAENITGEFQEMKVEDHSGCQHKVEAIQDLVSVRLVVSPIPNSCEGVVGTTTTGSETDGNEPGEAGGHKPSDKLLIGVIIGTVVALLSVIAVIIAVIIRKQRGTITWCTTTKPKVVEMVELENLDDSTSTPVLLDSNS